MKEQDNQTQLTMPFGYYEGKPLEEVPVEHLKYCLEHDCFETLPEHEEWAKNHLTAHSS